MLINVHTDSRALVESLLRRAAERSVPVVLIVDRVTDWGAQVAQRGVLRPPFQRDQLLQALTEAIGA